MKSLCSFRHVEIFGCSCLHKVKHNLLVLRSINTRPGIPTRRPSLAVKRKTQGSKQNSYGNNGHLKNSIRATESIVTPPKEFLVNSFGFNPAFMGEQDKKSNSQTSIIASTFSEITGLRKDVIDGIESLKISQPTVIQMKTIPLILKGKNVICAAQTGSGKTLAYLIPILNILKNEEESGVMARLQHPRACIIAPFRELGLQILQVVKHLSHQVPLRSVGCVGGEKDSIMFKKLKEKPVDILVGTPGTVADLLRKRKISFDNMKFMVIDEVDTMYDTSFIELTNQLFKNAQSPTFVKRSENEMKTDECKFIFAAATLPKHGVLNSIKENVKNVEVVTAKLHHVLPNVNYHFIKCLQPEKPEELIKILSSKISHERKGIIFVNSSVTCKWLSKYFAEKGVPHLKLFGKDNPEERHKIVKEYRSQNSGVIISTDLASRGLDFPDLSFVINYECPLNATDFIHRAGRTGRARAEYSVTPVVYTLLSRNWELILARKIQFAADNRKAIGDVKAIQRKQSLVQIVKR